MADPIRELLSQVSYDADGTTTIWNFSFAGGYIDRSHVKVQLLDKVTLVPSELPITDANFIGDFQLQLIPAISADYEITIYRNSPKDVPLVNFADRAALTEAALDLNAKQAIFVAAESSDQLAVALDSVTKISAQVEVAREFAEAAEASADEAAAAAGSAAASAGEGSAYATTAGTQAAAAAASATAADASATAAATSAGQALAYRNTASTHATTATTKAAEATTSADAAAASASSAGGSAADALASRNAAAGSASAAAGSATAAAGSATTASTGATTATTQAGIATTKAAEAAASAASIAGGPVSSFAGLTGAITAAQAQSALLLPADTVTALAGKLATTGTAAAATKLFTPRAFTVGAAAAKNFDGTAAVSWTLTEIAGTTNPTEATRAMPLVATQAQANAGTDDTAMITAKKLAAAVVSNVTDDASTHLIRLPGNYVLVQATAIVATNSAGGGSIVYPITFATPPRVVMSLGDNGYRSSASAIAAQIATTGFGFQLENDLAATVRINYFAMGRAA